MDKLEFRDDRCYKITFQRGHKDYQTIYVDGKDLSVNDESGYFKAEKYNEITYDVNIWGCYSSDVERQSYIRRYSVEISGRYSEIVEYTGKAFKDFQSYDEAYSKKINDHIKSAREEVRKRIKAIRKKKWYHIDIFGEDDVVGAFKNAQRNLRKLKMIRDEHNG
jgi:hypothetical protein